jgi:ABC-2 type transport system permease protein
MNSSDIEDAMAGAARAKAGIFAGAGAAAIKYAAVARNSLADALAWRAELVLGLASAAGRVLIALILWGAIFDGRAEVAGMSLGAMTSYYLVAVFISQLDRSSVMAGVLALEIRSGNFGKYLARPVDALAWFLSSSFGRSAFQAGMTAAATIACALAISGLLVPPDPIGLLAAIAVALLGLFAFALVNFMTGILAFAFQDIGAFNIAKNCIVEFLSGALVPLALLPEGLKRALELSPFPALASLPAELILGPSRGGTGLEALPTILLRLALWDLGLLIAARALFKALSGRYEELGS